MQESWLDPSNTAMALVIHAVGIIPAFCETFQCMSHTWSQYGPSGLLRTFVTFKAFQH